MFATDKNIQQAFSSQNIISPQDLEENCSIYLNIPEDKLDQWSVPVNLIVRKFLKHFERRPDEKAAPVLFVLDEFPRLGKVEGIAAALSTLRSKKITIALVLQSPAQLDMIYGHAAARVIMDNCVYKAILGACDAESQETFSLLMGTQSVEQQGMSTNYAPGSEEERGRTVSSHAIDQRIIQPHKYATLKDVVLLTPFGNFRAGKFGRLCVRDQARLKSAQTWRSFYRILLRRKGHWPQSSLGWKRLKSPHDSLPFAPVAQ